ncbi:MAG: response regulator transcription factor [Candidatus Kapaibacteriota bacterium]|jgi:DNA-binding response OmpR family regulator
MIRILFISSDSNEIPLGIQSHDWETIPCSEQEISSAAIHRQSYDVLIWHTKTPNSSFAKEKLGAISYQSLIVLTSACDEKNRILMLQSGVDDIIDESISDEELQLKIRAITRHFRNQVQSGIIQIGKYRFDYERRTLSNQSDVRILTTKEAELLKFLANRLNQPVNKNDALSIIWGEDSYHNGRSMDVYIGKLRKYLQSDENIQIMNIHGIGYKLTILS